MTLGAGNVKIAPMVPIAWAPSSGPMWLNWICLDLPRNSSEPVCCPRRLAPNPDLYNRLVGDRGDEGSGEISLVECEWAARGMPRGMGIQRDVWRPTCRLCSTCRTGFKRKGLTGAPCARGGRNRALLALGILAVLFGAAFTHFHRKEGAVEVSEAVKKILLNYLQVVTLPPSTPCGGRSRPVFL